MKAAIAICIYVILFNLYIYELTKIPIRHAVLMYNYITLGMIVFYVLNQGDRTPVSRQFNLMCILAVIANYVLIILTHHKVINSPVEMFLIFNGLIFAATVIIAINLKRHGFFNT